MPLSRFLPDDLANELIAEEVRANQTHVAVTVRSSKGGQYLRQIHLVNLDDGSWTVLADGASPRWIPASEPDDGIGAPTHIGAHPGHLTFLRDGKLYAIAPERGATADEPIVTFDEGPIAGYEWSPDGRCLAFRVLADSAPYNATYSSTGALISTRRTMANEISDDRGHHGSQRHQLFVGWADGPGQFAYADLTGHLIGAGDARPGNREIDLFCWSPGSDKIAFTGNYGADADVHAGQLVYLTELAGILNWADDDYNQQLPPLPPRRLIDAPRIITSLNWSSDNSLLLTTPGHGRAENPGAHHTLAELAIPGLEPGRIRCIDTTVNIGATPLFGAGTHQGGQPKVIPPSVPANAPEGWGTLGRVYFQAHTGAGSALLRCNQQPQGELSSPEVVFDDPQQSVRAFSVVEGSVTLDERKKPEFHDRVIAVTTGAHQPSSVLDVTPGKPPRALLTLPSPLESKAKPTVTTIGIRIYQDRYIPTVVYEPPEEYLTDTPPMILYLKGGPFTAVTDNSYLPEPLLLASLGFRVFAPNLAGSDLGDEDETLSQYTRWGELALKDAKKIAQWIRWQQHTVTSAGAFTAPPIGLIGMSAGAYTAAGLLLDDPEAFACAGIERGLLDIASRYFTVDDLHYSQSLFGPYSAARSREDSLLVQLERRADKLELPPMLLLQGNEDYRTSIGQSWAVLNALRLLPSPGGQTSKTPHELHSFVGANHMVSFTGSPESRCAYYWTMLTFMNNHLIRAPTGFPPQSPDELRAALTHTRQRTPPPWPGSNGGARTHRLAPVTYPTGRSSRLTP